MSPKEAKTIYYKAYEAEYKRQHLKWDQPVVQHDAEMVAWKAVIDAIAREIDNDWAKKYLALQGLDGKK